MKRRTTVEDYMNEIVDYGGLHWRRAEVIRDMQRMGHPQAAIDRWFQCTNLLRRFGRGGFKRSLRRQTRRF